MQLNVESLPEEVTTKASTEEITKISITKKTVNELLNSEYKDSVILTIVLKNQPTIKITKSYNNIDTVECAISNFDESIITKALYATVNNSTAKNLIIDEPPYKIAKQTAEVIADYIDTNLKLAKANIILSAPDSKIYDIYFNTIQHGYTVIEHAIMEYTPTDVSLAVADDEDVENKFTKHLSNYYLAKQPKRDILPVNAYKSYFIVDKKFEFRKGIRFIMDKLLLISLVQHTNEITCHNDQYYVEPINDDEQIFLHMAYPIITYALTYRDKEEQLSIYINGISKSFVEGYLAFVKSVKTDQFKNNTVNIHLTTKWLYVDKTQNNPSTSAPKRVINIKKGSIIIHKSYT